MGILEVIKKDKNIRKIFGKQELVIIEKQLLGINLTPSEKTRLSRDIRKKLEAIASLADFSEGFKLKQGAVVKEKIEDLKEIILKSSYFPKIKKIILFGSSIDRTRTFRSDIDVAVEFDKIDSREAVQFRLEILKDTDKKTDVQVYNVLPDKIKREIDLNGRVLYNKEKDGKN
jgi:predicted nucleotidyltransferase